MSPTENMARLRHLLSVADDELAAECLAEIEVGEVVLNNRGKTDAATIRHIHRALRDSYREDGGGEAGIVGYDQALSRLSALDGSVWSEDVVGSECVYVVFSTPGAIEDGEFVAILRNPNHNLSLLDGLRILMRSRPDRYADAHPSPGARFKQGEFVEEC